MNKKNLLIVSAHVLGFLFVWILSVYYDSLDTELNYLEKKTISLFIILSTLSVFFSAVLRAGINFLISKNLLKMKKKTTKKSTGNKGGTTGTKKKRGTEPKKPGYAKRFKQKFTAAKLFSLNSIKVSPEIFQGRSVPFASSTVDKIVREGFDTSQEPIVLFKDTKGRSIVISGHSRYEAAKRLVKKQKDMQKIPVKFFKGSFDEAVDYAVIESNRSGAAEGIESDIKAYLRAVQRGYNKDFLRGIFKSDSYIETLRNLSVLKPAGDFIKNLAQTSERSFPYLLRNAIWVGTLRRIYDKLTNRHEKEMFNFFYSQKGKGLKVSKQSFFDTIKKRVESPTFKSSDSLRLGSEKDFDFIAEKDPGYIKYKQIISAIDQRRAERNNKEQNFIYFMINGQRGYAEKAAEEIKGLTADIQNKLKEMLRLKGQLKIEDKRLQTGGLFN